MPTVILDNGGYSIKAGYATAESPRVIPNCISKARSERRRPFIGDQIDDCRDTSGLFFILPFQKGYMVNADTEKTIWDYVFGKDVLNVNTPSETDVIVTEPQFNFKSLQEAVCELLFEEYEFRSVCRTTSATQADYYYSVTEAASKPSLCTLVIDCGYSFTHIVPYVNGVKVSESIRRIDVGGKALTNHLKEIVSYRQLHVLDETYLINQVKEDACFVSQDLKEDMKIAKKRFPENTIMRDYVLPDYSTIRRGYVRKLEETGQAGRENEQILRLNNERFTVPELLFHPSDVGIPQMGITEAVVSIIESFPEPLRPHFYDNVVLIGGTASFPGFKEKILMDLRSSASIYYDTNVFKPENPTTYPWEGAKKFSQDPEFFKYLVSRNAYSEKGINAFAKISDI